MAIIPRYRDARYWYPILTPISEYHVTDIGTPDIDPDIGYMVYDIGDMMTRYRVCTRYWYPISGHIRHVPISGQKKNTISGHRTRYRVIRGQFAGSRAVSAHEACHSESRASLGRATVLESATSLSHDCHNGKGKQVGPSVGHQCMTCQCRSSHVQSVHVCLIYEYEHCLGQRCHKIKLKSVIRVCAAQHRRCRPS